MCLTNNFKKKVNRSINMQLKISAELGVHDACIMQSIVFNQM